MVNTASTICPWVYPADVLNNEKQIVRFVIEPNKKTSVVLMSQCYIIKQMVNAIACTIELWMHLGGWLNTQEARVALGYCLVRVLRFFRA